MPNEPTEPQWEEIEAYLYAGQKIAAIKLFRQYAQADLKEAKDALDLHDRELRAQFPDRFKKPAGCSVTAGMLFLAAGAVWAAAALL